MLEQHASKTWRRINKIHAQSLIYFDRWSPKRTPSTRIVNSSEIMVRSVNIRVTRMCNDCYFDLNDPIFVQDTIRKSWQLVDWQQLMWGGVMESKIQCLDQVKRYVGYLEWLYSSHWQSIHHSWDIWIFVSHVWFFLLKASRLIEGDLWSQTDAERII